MAEITNKEIYTERMSKTMEQKAWFVDKLPDKIDTILDVGGGNGDLGVYIRDHFDRKFQYFVHDVTDIYIDDYRKNFPDGGYWYYPDYPLDAFEKMLYSFDPNTTVVVFSSVCHEIYNYSGEKYFIDMLNALKFYGYEYLAFRDMSLYIPKHGRAYLLDPESEGFKKLLNSDIYNDYINRAKTNHGQFSVWDLLMKYDYKENWDRESIEYYFWQWVEKLLEYYPNAEVHRYSIPYQVNKIKEDWDIDVNYLTHANVLVKP